MNDEYVCSRDVVGRHAHEEDSGSVGVDVAVHPFGPRLEHLPVRHRPVHQRVLAPPLLFLLLLLLLMAMATSAFPEHALHFISTNSLHCTAEYRHQPSCETYVHDFHLECVEPPDVRVEDEVVDALPVLGVLGDGAPGDDTVHDAVHLRVVRVGLDQERRPIELHSGVVILP